MGHLTLLPAVRPDAEAIRALEAAARLIWWVRDSRPSAAVSEVSQQAIEAILDLGWLIEPDGEVFDQIAQLVEFDIDASVA